MPEKSKSVESIPKQVAAAVNNEPKANQINSNSNQKTKVTFSKSQEKKNNADVVGDVGNEQESDEEEDDDDDHNNENNDDSDSETEDEDEDILLEYLSYSSNNKETENRSSKPEKQQISSEEKQAAQSANSSNQPMKREITNEDGSKDIWYSNGNLKKISADGLMIRMLYFNKDIKETNVSEGTVKYYYAESNTWHTTYLDGLEILEFPNGQVEHRHANGVIEVHYPNNSVKKTDPADQTKLEEWRFADGTHLVQLRTGERILSMPNGQKEIHTKLHKRREYPDGTVKLVYPDGSTETRYSNGRIRLKDNDGKLVLDTDLAK